MDSVSDTRAIHVVNRCQVGQEVPCYDNRTVVMPRCYVPSGSSGPKEAAPPQDAGSDTNTSPAPDTGLYREETGLQYASSTSLICPFMVMQRTTLDQYFQPLPNISIHTPASSEAEALPTPSEVLERGILTAARMASTIPQSGGQPTAINFSSPYSASFAAESSMMPKSSGSGAKKAPRMSQEQFVHMDLEVRLGVAAVAPEGIVSHPPKLLSQEQFEYVSRFQLLSDRKAASAEAASVLAPEVGDAEASSPVVEEERVSVVNALTLGIFDPFIPAAPHGEVHKALSKMSKSTLSKGREAVLSKTIQPKFRLVFQNRNAIPLAHKDSGSSKDTLVLETPDGGNSWYEVVQQNTVSAITTPMINSTHMSLESVMVAKHIRVCTTVEEEWATYYLHNLFCESMKFKTVAGVAPDASPDEATAEEQEAAVVEETPKSKTKGKAKKAPALKHMTFQSLSAVGFLHPESSTAEMRSLVKKWQLVSLEKSELSLAHCIDSGEVLPSLPRAVHTRGVFDDLEKERKFCHATGSEVDTTSAVTPTGGGARSNLFIASWLHTTTHYIDNGISFLRGDTTFRRRLTFSNPALHNAMSAASVTAAKPMMVDKIHLPTRLCSALQSVTNEGLNLLTHRLGVGPVAGSVLMDLISDTVPAFVFPSDRGSQQADAIALAPPVATPLSSKRPSPTVALISVYKQAIQAGMQLSTAIAIKKHAQYLSEHTIQHLPTVGIAQASAFHAVIPWHLVRFPVVLNSFHDVKIPANIPTVGTISPTPAIAGDARFSNALALSTALLRNRGASLLFVSRKAVMTSNELAAFDAGILSPEALQLPSVSMDVFDELTTQRPLSYEHSELRQPRKTGNHRDAADQSMENLLRMKIPQAMERLGRAARLGGSKADSKLVYEAPVFCANFGSEQSSFAVESLLRRALPRILGKSIKTTVSAITLSDLPSKTLKAMDAPSRQHALDVLSPLGTRYVTSVFLDSKDASKSFVMDISKRASGPFSQELLVQTVLRRMLSPSSLRLGQVNVQTSGGPDEDEIQRELWEEDSQNVDRSFYRLDWVPEDALNVFRGNATLIKASITQDANRVKALRGGDVPTTTKNDFEAQLAELGDDGRKAHLDDLRKNNAKFNYSLTTGGSELSIDDQQLVDADVSGGAYKGLISSAVNVSKVLLDNTRPVKIAELLESQVKGDSVFAYLPQLLDALALDGDGVENTEASKKKLERLLSRDMSRVIFAEDRTFRAEGVLMGNTSAPGSTPPMFVVSRTIHDISTGIDGVARYETNTMLFFTTRDPAIIVGGNGDMTRLEGLLGKDGGGASSDSLVIEEALHVFRNLGRWMVDNTFASPTDRDVVEKEGETSAGRSVQDVLKGWTDSALARQSSDVLEMVQGDEKLAANRLTHVLVHAARLSGEAVEATCRNELLHWIGALGSAAGVITVKDLEHAYIHSQLHLVMRRCGIPLKPSSMFFSKVQHELLKERGENPARANADPHLQILPCDTYCRLTKELVLRVGLGDKGGVDDHDNSLKSTLVPIFLPSTLHTSDGMVVPEGTLAFVGHASTQLIRECGHFFGDLVALHQVGDFLMIPATEDVDVQVGVELSNAQDQVWKSPMESQFARMKTLEGHPVVMKRNRFGQFAPPSLFERTFIEGSKLYQIPTVGAPLYREGKLVTFNKGVGTHSFVSSVLRTGNMRKMISYLAKK